MSFSNNVFATLLFLSSCLLSGITSAAEVGGYDNRGVIRGTVFSTGRVDPSEDIGTGYFFDANYTSVALNFGASTKKFGDLPGNFNFLATDCPECVAEGRRVNNAYIGVGFSRLLQLQIGAGNEGRVTRFRSDFNFRSIVNFLTQTQTRKDRMLLADRLTFTTAIEEYEDEESEGFNNLTWGIGLLF